MSEEEYMECSVVAYPRQIKFLHINGGAISYYVDRHVSDYVDRLQQENQELKKQLHEASIEMQEMIEQDIECPSNCSKLKEILNQQKEFIKYLEDEINSIEPKGTGINYNCEYDSEEDYIKGMKERSKLNTFKEILSKYREIGVSNENNT